MLALPFTFKNKRATNFPIRNCIRTKKILFYYFSPQMSPGRELKSVAKLSVVINYFFTVTFQHLPYLNGIKEQ
jgi:hypothetical protein